MSSSTSSSDGLRIGLASLRDVVRWIAAEAWLALLLAVLLVTLVSVATATRVPPSGSDHALVDTQLRRSRTIPETDVLVIGDSSGLTSIDPVQLSRALGGRRVELLSAIGPVRPVGYARLLRNYLERGLSADLVLLVVHPFSLMHQFKATSREEMDAVLNGRWPSAGWIEDGRRGINRVLLGGILDEPFPTSFGPLYANDRQIEEFVAATRGSLIQPSVVERPPAAGVAARAGTTPPRAVEYKMTDEGRATLLQMRELLDEGPPVLLSIAFGPIPESIGGEKPPWDRKRMLVEAATLLGLPEDRVLELPPTLPDVQMAEPTHPGARGRQTFTAAVAPVIARALERAASPACAGAECGQR